MTDEAQGAPTVERETAADGRTDQEAQPADPASREAPPMSGGGPEKAVGVYPALEPLGPDEQVVELPERSAMSVIGFGFGGGAVPDPDLVVPASGDELQGYPGEK